MMKLLKSFARSLQSPSAISQSSLPPPEKTDVTPYSFNCPAVSAFFLAFPFHHIDGVQVLSFCCELSLKFPSIRLCETGKETIKRFLEMRAQFISEGIFSAIPFKQSISDVCINCPQYQLRRWKNDELIRMVHLSMTPAPCQSKCIYCEVIHMPEKFNDPIVQENYRRAFDALDYAEKSGLIAPDARWMISSGEITIHPYKDKILDIVKNKDATFFTNGFLFDEKIKHILSSNPRSHINLSIDSGTADTWFKVKGVDNFGKVVENLKQYAGGNVRTDAITLKYIMLPGINNFPGDYAGIARIMKMLNVSELIISRERRSYELSNEQHAELIRSVGELAGELVKNGLKYTLHSYSPDEKRQVAAIVSKAVS